MIALGTAPPAASGALKHGEYCPEMCFQAWEVSPEFSYSTGGCQITPGFLIPDCVEIVAALYRFFILFAIHADSHFPMEPNDSFSRGRAGARSKPARLLQAKLARELLAQRFLKFFIRLLTIAFGLLLILPHLGAHRIAQLGLSVGGCLLGVQVATVI